MAFEDTTHRPIPAEETNNHGHGKRYTHPAFAQIAAHRLTGGMTALYGSDFLHSNAIRITIKRSQLVRNLSHDWHHGDDNLIELEMSEAQWATFVSSMNMGDGTPCTLRHVGGEQMPGIQLEQRPKQFDSELRGHVAEAMAEIDDVLAKLPKGGEAAGKLRRARMMLHDNLPFIAKSFGEHMERHVEKAKTEIHGYMNGVMQRLGLSAAQSGAPLSLEPPKDDDDAQ